MIADGYEWRHVEYAWVCTSGGGTGGSQPPGGGQPPGYGGGSLPSITIVSASDENPHQVTLAFDYSNGSTMSLKYNGYVLSSGPPSSQGFYGSLDNMTSGGPLEVELCNAYGCSSSAIQLVRRTDYRGASGAVGAPWIDEYITPDGQLTYASGFENYTRAVRAEFFYADYSTPTVGARNGRVQHVQTWDALYWNFARSPIWVTRWQYTPFWLPYAQYAEAGHAAGCYLAGLTYQNSDTQCAYLGEFASGGSPGGAAEIASIQAQDNTINLPMPPAYGDISLTLVP